MSSIAVINVSTKTFLCRRYNCFISINLTKKNKLAWIKYVKDCQHWYQHHLIVQVIHEPSHHTAAEDTDRSASFIQVVWTFQASRRARITSEVSAAGLIGPLWINVMEGSSRHLLTPRKAFQTHWPNPTGSGSRYVQFSTAGFQDEVLLVLPRPPWTVSPDRCGNCTGSWLTCHFASCCAASNGDDHAGHMTSPQETLVWTTARRPVSSPHSYLFKVRRDRFRLSAESIEGGRDGGEMIYI